MKSGQSLISKAVVLGRLFLSPRVGELKSLFNFVPVSRLICNEGPDPSYNVNVSTLHWLHSPVVDWFWEPSPLFWTSSFDGLHDDRVQKWRAVLFIALCTRHQARCRPTRTYNIIKKPGLSRFVMLPLIVKNVLYAVNIVSLMQINFVTFTVHQEANQLWIGTCGYFSF